MLLIRHFQYVSEIWTNLTWLWWFGFRLEPISDKDQATAIIVALFKNGQKWHKNNHLATFSKDQSKSLIYFIQIASLLSLSDLYLDKINTVYIKAYAEPGKVK